MPLLEYIASGGTPFGIGVWLTVGVDGGGDIVVYPGSVFARAADTAGNDHYLATLGANQNAPSLQINQWNHVAATFDQVSGLMVIYLNGAAAASGNLGSFTPLSTTPLVMGNYPGTPLLNGLLDEAQLYNRALSAAEILAIYQSDSVGVCKPAAHVPPSVSAGANQVTTLPANTLALNGVVSDSTGQTPTISWTEASGPGITFGTPNLAVTAATFTAPGA